MLVHPHERVGSAARGTENNFDIHTVDDPGLNFGREHLVLPRGAPTESSIRHFYGRMMHALRACWFIRTVVSVQPHGRAVSSTRACRFIRAGASLGWGPPQCVSVFAVLALNIFLLGA